MKMLRKLFAPTEVKAAFGALDEASSHYQSNLAFDMVRKAVENLLLSHSSAVASAIRHSGGRTPREWVYSQIGNVAGDMLESGQHHIYRGVLSYFGHELLHMFDDSHDVLLAMNAIDPDYAQRQKAAIRRSIKNVG